MILLCHTFFNTSFFVLIAFLFSRFCSGLSRGVPARGYMQSTIVRLSSVPYFENELWMSSKTNSVIFCFIPEHWFIINPNDVGGFWMLKNGGSTFCWKKGRGVKFWKNIFSIEVVHNIYLILTLSVWEGYHHTKCLVFWWSHLCTMITYSF